MIRKAKAVWRGTGRAGPVSKVLNADITLDAKLIS
jgi:hypothetical protein